MNYLGLEIEVSEYGYTWKYGEKTFDTLEDVKADMESYFWEEIEYEKERREDDYLLT